MATRSDDPSTLDCTAAQEAIRTFAGARVPRGVAQRLRAHLLECADCKAAYRDALETAAQLGQEVRRGREASDARRSAARREENRQAVLEAGATRRVARPNSFALRTILVPAFFFFLMVWVTKIAGGGPDAYLVEARGEVFVGDTPVPSRAEELRLKRGDWIFTAANSAARVEVGGSELSVGADTKLLVESPDERRFRFRGGTLEVANEAEITTSYGILEIANGECELEHRDGSFEIHCVRGHATFVDGGGSHALEAADRLLRGRN